MNAILEFLMQIVNPALWSEYEKSKNATVHEMRYFKEDATEDDFIEIMRIANERLSHVKQNADTPAPEPTPPPVGPNGFPQRPPGVPPMRDLSKEGPVDPEERAVFLE